MPASINSTSSSPGGLVTTGDVDNELVIQTGDVTAISIDASQNVAFTGAVSTSGAVSATTLTVNSNNISADNSLGFRNRIINGDMRIDQRNAGASVTPTDGSYTLDRYLFRVSQASKLTVQRSTTAPTGFTNSMLVTSTAATSVGAADFFAIDQRIEGFNVYDFGFGTANAVTVTLSFWVRSSLTGTFGGSLANGAFNRSYPFTYTISVADTWEQKSITIAGDTTGTWATDSSTGLRVQFGLGVGADFSGTAGSWQAITAWSATGATSVVGTNGATFYITGVQLEVGSVATPFERRPYGTELALCQRYYYRTADDGATTNIITVGVEGATAAVGGVPHPVPMRAVPTIGLGAGIRFFSPATSVITPSILASRASSTTFAAEFGISGATAGQAGSIYRGTANGYLEASAEL